jgi:hypothetical protein
MGSAVFSFDLLEENAAIQLPISSLSPLANEKGIGRQVLDSASQKFIFILIS